MAELDEIKLLLKDQIAARKQQFDAFQEQMATLQAELQATKGLIQAGSYGCGGETASPIPCSIRFDVPKFSGIDPNRWIFSITEYFTLLSTMVDQRLRVVGLNLEGDAEKWFRLMMRHNLITTWDGFLESVRHFFGPCKYKDPQGAFMELLQKGTVAQYQGEFEKLMYCVTDVSDGLLISFYISGLKPTLQRILLVSNPTSLGDSFSLARITEARLEDREVSSVSNTTIVNSGGGQNQKDVALESGDISSLNSLVGNGSPLTLQLCGTIGLGNIHVLIDNESTHNFVQPSVVERMKLTVSITKPFKVYIGSGETLLCENICSKVGINMQGIAMEVDLYMLMMKGMLRRQQQ
nr:hypothetical protein [Tanacetum cinerariifolium]